MITMRFGKLQDVIGSKIFSLLTTKANELLLFWDELKSKISTLP